MGLLAPTPPPYDPIEWQGLPFARKARMVCRAWAVQGYGTPLGAFALHAFKVLGYIAAWVWFCSFTPGLGGWSDLPDWWLHPIAFQKAIVWSLMFEVIGLGCGSGPLTGRYFPPLGGALYFLRPGTTKAPLFAGAPIIGGLRRTWLEVGVYAALLGCLGWTLVHPAPGLAQFLPVIVLVAVLGVLDTTTFLAARGEHFWVMVVCFAFAGNWIAGAKVVALALWFWAGTSKLNHHFPAVVCVMTSNSPVTRIPWLRRLMYRDYPNDLNPSPLATRLAHAGTALELAVPIVLALGNGGTVTTVGLVLAIMLHGYITSNVPMGVPIEWNVVVLYGAFFLFGAHAQVSVFDVGSIPVAALLVLTTIAIPLLGNLYPARISFLLAMRYYAGNWPCSVWLFRRGAERRLETGLVRTSPWVYEQLDRFYDRPTSVGLVGKVVAFRLMHLHGRALPLLLPKAVDDPNEYEWLDGEMVAGMVLGWNFGDGHLHRESLLAAVQAQCGFEEGELRCIFLEAQPMLRGSLHWRVHDAKTGLIQQGHVSIAELRTLQPWPAEDGVPEARQASAES